jgi:hypothetical protein
LGRIAPIAPMRGYKWNPRRCSIRSTAHPRTALPCFCTVLCRTTGARYARHTGLRVSLACLACRWRARIGCDRPTR